jgi:NAD(P)H-dependent FMN reductase
MILILTQSSKKGKNQLIAEDCATLVRHFFSNVESSIRNFDEGHIPFEDYDKVVMVVPEWNGSIPFTLKQMIDNSGWPSALKNKDIYLIGTSGGIGGNMRGISHLTDILHYVGANVSPTKVYVTQLESFDKESPQAIAATEMIRDQMKELCSTYINV